MSKEQDARWELSAGREPLTTHDILEANHSDLANDFREEWNETAQRKEHTLIDTCADKRLTFTRFFADPKSTSGRNVTIEKIRYIAAAGFARRFEQIARDPANGEILVSPHFNCGGQGVKEKVESGETSMESIGIGYVVHDRIVSANPYQQALHTAHVLSLAVSDKPVYASVTDHETGLVTVFSRFEGGKITAGTDAKALKESPQPDELPSLYLTDNLAQKLAFNKVFVETTGSDPRFQERQRTQNPQAVTITTDRRPKSLTTPGIEDFTLGLPFNGDSKTVTPQDFYEILCQAEYPLMHASEANEGGNFYSTSTILIETPSMDTSLALAGTLSMMSCTKRWFETAPRTIFVGEIKDGRIQNLDVFKQS